MDTLILAQGATLPLGIIGWIVIGGLAGWIASKIMGTDAQMGLGLNIVVGIIGGFIGGIILSLFFDVGAGGWWFSFFTCLLGAVILLWIVGLFTKNRAKR